MRSVRYHPAADEELRTATSWYLERSFAAADGFVREIEHAITRILDAPVRYPRTRYGGRRFVLLSYPFDIVYREQDGGEIEIVAVAHHSRKPAYWRRR